MAPRKGRQPAEKFGLELSAAQRKALLDRVLISREFEDVIRATPASAPVEFTLKDWEDLGDAVADEAGRTEDRRLEIRLSAILEQIADLMDRQGGEVDAPLLRLFEPSDEPAQGDSRLGDVTPEMLLSLASGLEQMATVAGEKTTIEIHLTKAEAKVLAAHAGIEESLVSRLRTADASHPVTLTLVELLALGMVLSSELELVRGKEAAHLAGAMGKISDSVEELFIQMAPPKPRKKKAATVRARPAKDCVYQLKITLKDSEPSIWRRVLTRDCTLKSLHEIIQVSMGWGFSHLYAFEVKDERYTEAFEGIYGPDEHPASRHRLSQLHQKGVRQFDYVYDFGDNWEHTIELEKTVSPEPKGKYPRCLDGARACPPEDSGGIWGYKEILRVLHDPKDPDRRETLEWLGGEFDPEGFDLKQVNRGLATLRR